MKKSRLKIIVLLLAILVLVGGTTYAYFTVNANGRAKSLFEVSSISNEVVLLKTVTDKLHVHMSATDFAIGNIGDFYGTDNDTLPYVKTITDANKNLVSIEVTGAKDDLRQKCSAKIKLTMEGNMSDIVRPEDLIMHLSIQGDSDDIDLSSMKVSKNITSKLEFNLTGNQKDYIKGYITLKNRNNEQNYLADTSLNVYISLDDLKCEVQNSVR